MKKLMILFFIVILLSCCDSDDQSSGDLFSIAVTDVDGMPVSGLDIQVCNSIISENECGRASTVISYTLIEECHVNLEIFDIYNQHVFSLIEGIYCAGLYSALWDGNNDAEEQANLGGTNIFKYKLTVTNQEDSTDVIFRDWKYMCMNLNLECCECKIGVTDVEGMFAIDDLCAFPHLLHGGLGDQPEMDGDGQMSGTFLLTDSIHVMLVNPLTEEFMQFTVLMDDSSSNHYELVWDNQQMVTDKGSIKSSDDLSADNLRGVDDDLFSEYHLYQNYPNPFK